MRHVLHLILLRNARSAPLRAVLTMLGIMLGVSVVFAIAVVNRSVMTSFRLSLDDVTGKAGLTVGMGTGVAEELLELVKAVPGVAAAVPIIEDSLRDAMHGTMLAVIGVDTMADGAVREYRELAGDLKIEDEVVFLNDPHGVLITRAYSQRTGVRVGDKLSLETMEGVQEFTARGILSPRGPAKVFGGDVLVMDVFAAQISFARGRRFDRIDVVPSPGEDLTKLTQRIAKAIGFKAEVARPARRSEEADRLLASFKLALSLTSLVAIFVGAFIVYNALAIAVAQRRREIGILRALGMTRLEVRTLFVGEGALMGVIGSLLGLLLGLGLARAVLGMVGATVSALFAPVRPEELVVTSADLFLAGGLGVAASVVAAWFPARRAAHVEPVLAMQKKPEAADVTFASGGSSLRAALLAGMVAAAVALAAHALEDSLLGHLVGGLIAISVACAAPAIAVGVGFVARHTLARMGPAALLGALSFSRDAGRSAVAIAALGTALANVIAVDTLLSSMKTSTEEWLHRSFRADIFMFAGTDVNAKFSQSMPESVGEHAAALSEVEFVQAFRMAKQSFRGEPFYLMSEDLTGYQRYNELAVVEGDFRKSFAALRDGRAVAASQSFAKHFGVHMGDTLTLQTPGGPRAFRVALIYVDYRTDIGALLTDCEVYEQTFHDSVVDLYGVYLRKDSDAHAVRGRLAGELGARHRLMVLENREYMGELLGLIDRSLALSHAGELVALIVAVLGILNTLAVSVLDRASELGTLRALGASRRQVQKVVLVEAALMCFAASLAGLLMGVLLSAYSVRESLRFELGWQLDYTLSLGLVAATFVMAQLVGLCASLFPMRSAADVDAASALKQE